MLRRTSLALLVCACAALPTVFARGQIAQLSAGTILGNTYLNADLGFRYEFPSGWSVGDAATQTEEVTAGHQVEWQDDVPANRAPNSCTKNLLFVTRHPAGMQLSGVDPSVFLMAIDPKCVPGGPFPVSIKDHQAVQDVAKQVARHLKLNAAASRGPLRLKAFDLGGRVMLEIDQPLIVSSWERGTTTVQSVYSSTLLMQAGRYWVMWWLTSDTDYNLERLRRSKIFFDSQSGMPSGPR